jgi:hypothetical protein
LLVIEAGHERGVEVLVTGMGQLVDHPWFGHVVDSRACVTTPDLERSNG